MRSLGVLLLMFLLCACRQFEETSFSIQNKTNEELQVKVFKKWRVEEYDVYPGKSQIIIKIKGIEGSGFENIALVDSIKIMESVDRKIIKWYQPDNGFGYISFMIGEERPIPKDIYNRSQWTHKGKLQEDIWNFSISQKDLDLFRKERR